MQWFSKTIDEWRGFFHGEITKKARHDYVCAQSSDRDGVKQLMEQNSHRQITVQDSVEKGNCKVGTTAFLKRYGINRRECLIKDLLENKGIDEMLQSFEFRKTVLSVIESINQTQ